MGTTSPSRRLAWIGAVLCAVTILAADPALGQSCAQRSPAITTCRFLLSQPRSFTLQARAVVNRTGQGGSAKLTIALDGTPCFSGRQTRVGRRSILNGDCRVVLQPTGHVIEARVDAQDADPGGVRVVLLPNSTLASLPRESRDLYPPKSPKPGRLHWPFWR